MTIDYKDLKKEFIKKQRKLDKKEVAKNTAKAFNLARQKRQK